MQKQIVHVAEIKLVGMAVRTNNKDEFNPQKAKIGGLVASYWQKNQAAQIAQRKKPGRTLCVYQDYESDEHGDYTYVIGEEVASFENVPAGFLQITIPAAKFQKFTTPPGKMPMVVINAWQEIWKMSLEQLGGKRTYEFDFEVYDERVADPDNAVMDIYIGIK